MENESERNETEEDVRIGFLTVRELDQTTYRAGLLVTNAKGKPLELRATGPLRPDRIQTLIYGETLIPTIAQELCGQPLIESLRERPGIIAVDHEAFLPLHSLEQPVVYIRRSGEELEIELGTATGTQEPHTEEVLQPPAGRFQPVVLKFSAEVSEDQTHTLRTKLAGLFRVFDLVEPFDRVAKALQMLQEQESKKET